MWPLSHDQRGARINNKSNIHVLCNFSDYLDCFKVKTQCCKKKKKTHCAPVAQLVEHRAVTREVVSSTPAGPTLRVFK